MKIYVVWDSIFTMSIPICDIVYLSNYRILVLRQMKNKIKNISLLNGHNKLIGDLRVYSSK